MQNALVSAVITSYNRPSSMLERAVKSVINQTYTNIELIVVDDNRDNPSGNEFSNQIKLLSDKYNFILLKTADGKHGGQAARNTGIIAAKGEYVAFLDDDDEWQPEKIRKQILLLSQRPDAGMCFCRGEKVDENFDPPKIYEYHGKDFKCEVTRKDLLIADCIGTTSQAVIRKTVLDEVGGFDERFPARQDYEMWVNITGNYVAVGVDEPLFLYHISKGEKSVARSFDKCIEGYKLLNEKYIDDIKCSKRARFNIIFHLGHFHWFNGARIVGAGYYIKAFLVSPMSFWDKGIIKINSIILQMKNKK